MIQKKDPKAPPDRTSPDMLHHELLTPVDIETFLAGGHFEESLIQKFDLSGKKLSPLNATFTFIEHVCFAGCEISSARLQEVYFSNCDLSNAVLRGFEASRVEFIDCRLVGMRAIECRWDVLVEKCDGRYAQFQDGHLRNCAFKGSNLGEADFRGTDLEGTRFIDVVLRRADLTGTKLRGTDLRGADIEGIVLHAEDVAGVVVNPAQVMDLAQLLGILVR